MILRVLFFDNSEEFGQVSEARDSVEGILGQAPKTVYYPQVALNWLLNKCKREMGSPITVLIYLEDLVLLFAFIIADLFVMS